jgi:hypothetical protein
MNDKIRSPNDPPGSPTSPTDPRPGQWGTRPLAPRLPTRPFQPRPPATRPPTSSPPQATPPPPPDRPSVDPASAPRPTSNVANVANVAIPETAGSDRSPDFQPTAIPIDQLSVIVSPTVRTSSGRPKGPTPSRIDAVRSAGRRQLLERARDATPSASLSQPSRESASPSARSGTTMSEGTLDQYLNRGRLLLLRYKRENGIPNWQDDIHPVEFINWLMSLKPTFKASTWRVYRQAAYHTVEGLPHHDTDQALAMLDTDFVEHTGEMKKGVKNDGTRRTSTLKEKKFPKDDFDRIVTYLKYFARSKLAPVLADWLKAGVWTGLRPIEWRATDLEERHADDGAVIRYLYVINGKATNGRGNGLVRTLDLSHAPSDVADAVRRMAQLGLEWFEDGRYDSMQSQCSQLLYGTAEKLFPGRARHYSLYSCRHQFVANAKAVMRAEEVSALVGHSITATAVQHYGRRRTSWPPDTLDGMPSPVPEEVVTVKQRVKFFEDRMKLQIQAGLMKPVEDDDTEGDEGYWPIG